MSQCQAELGSIPVGGVLGAGIPSGALPAACGARPGRLLRRAPGPSQASPLSTLAPEGWEHAGTAAGRLLPEPSSRRARPGSRGR